jgi:hypothetical protein
MRSGYLDFATFVTVFERFKPDVVILARYPELRQMFRQTLDQGQLTKANKAERFYVLVDRGSSSPYVRSVHSLESFESEACFRRWTVDCRGPCRRTLDRRVVSHRDRSLRVDIGRPGAGARVVVGERPDPELRAERRPWTRFSVYLPRRLEAGQWLQVSEAAATAEGQPAVLYRVRFGPAGVQVVTAAGPAALPGGLRDYPGRWLSLIANHRRREGQLHLWLNQVYLGRFPAGRPPPGARASLRVAARTGQAGGLTFHLDRVERGRFPSSVQFHERHARPGPSVLAPLMEAAFPRYPAQVREVRETIEVGPGQSFEGQMKLYRWTGPGACNQREGQPPIFRLRAGARLRDLYILNAPDGVHIDGGGVTVDNVRFLNVCEDAVTVNRGADVTIINSVFRGCMDKGIQINGGSRIAVRNNTFFACYHPLRVVPGVGGVAVSDNVFFQAAWGIKSDSPAITVQRNRFVHCEGGIWIAGAAGRGAVDFSRNLFDTVGQRVRVRAIDHR